MALCTESPIVVRYAETDRMGVVYHANYLVWMEIGRTDYLALIGFPYGKLENDGVVFPVCKAMLELLHPSYYDDRLSVLTRLEKLRSRKVVFGYRIVRGDETVVSGTTAHICVDPQMRVRKIPAWLFEALSLSLDGGGVN